MKGIGTFSLWFGILAIVVGVLAMATGKFLPAGVTLFVLGVWSLWVAYRIAWRNMMW